MTTRLEEARRKMIRAMVAEIGSEPLQDLHFDVWAYPEQDRRMPYETCVVSRYIELKAGESPSPVMQALADCILTPA